MFKNNLLAALFIISFASCNPIGTDITEVPLQIGEITSAEGVDLKKGDVVTIWSKVAAKEATPDFKIKFNVESRGQSLMFDSLNVMGGTHIVNSKKTTESYNSSSSAGDSTVYYTVWDFEIENKKFTVPRDGKYNFDFKLTKAGTSFPSSEISIILRKSI
ncbi:hypothetical protein [Pedobacter nototheniae]|uniref:hypothetical protein n=1 Tax=Pedobacter nototheniae TaxID=2488994 RepID=UPI00103FDBA8|nr:hypothetical protein [Pedobacter nototheniae]